MTDHLTPTTAHQTLDDKGWLQASHGPGVYALECEPPPDDPDAVHDRWAAHFETAPSGLFDSLAAADRLAYVGASSAVYGRIMDHAEGAVRQAAFLSVFEPVGVLGVEAADHPEEREYGYARQWAADGWAVWYDGMLMQV